MNLLEIIKALLLKAPARAYAPLPCVKIHRASDERLQRRAIIKALGRRQGLKAIRAARRPDRMTERPITVFG